MEGQTETAGVITTQLSGASGWTDHFPTYIIVRKPVPSKKGPSTITRRGINAKNINNFQIDLGGTDFLSTLVDDPSKSMETLMDTIMEVHERNFPLETVKIQRYDKRIDSFMTPGLLKSCQTKDKMLKNISKNKVKKTSPCYIRFTKYRNLLTTLIRKQKKNHYNEQFLKHKNDIRKTLDLVKGILNKTNDKHGITSTKFNIGGKLTENNEEITNGFNDFFANVGPTTNGRVAKSKNDHRHYLSKHSCTNKNSFSPTPVNACKVEEICSKIKKKTSCDKYGISQKLIMDNIGILSTSIAHVWNCSIHTGQFPSGAKVAKVIPVYKGKGLDETEFTNYRPISLLPIIGKVLEKIMHEQLVNFLNTNSILYESQYGFQSKHSTTHAMIDFVNYIGEAVDSGDVAYGVLCDLSKAFDTINHSCLLDKLDHYGIRGPVLSWFQSYLTDRTQYVSWQQVSSGLLPLTTGVPQGSVLGPLLFLLYINDLPSATSLLRVVLFADDSNLVVRGKDPTTLSNIMTAELANISDWFSANRLLLNPSKTKLIVFRSRKCRKDLTAPAVFLNGVELQQTTNESFLGVQLDETMKWYEHTCKLANNLSRKLGMLSKIKNFVSRRTLKMVYNCFFQPHLIYGIQLWGATFEKGLTRIQKLQKKAIRLITGARKMDHSEPRLKELGILKINDLYKLHTTCLVYDCLNGDAPAQLQGLFSYAADGTHTSTRSQTSKPLDIKIANPIQKPGSVLSSSFICKGLELWNDLPEPLQASASKEALRSKLKKSYLDQYMKKLPCKNALCTDIDHCYYSHC